MAQTSVDRTIDAPVEQVFDTVAHIDRYAKAIPHITEVEFLTEQHEGVGTRFAETRVMRGRQATTTLEVTEYVENERVRLVADEGGTVWDTLFTFREAGSGTKLEMVMDARPHSLLARIVNPLTKGIIRKAIEGDMDAVKAYCEAQASDQASTS